MTTKLYKIVGDGQKLLHPTGGYIRNKYGNKFEELFHVMKLDMHGYHFGEELGSTSVIIKKIDGDVYLDIIGDCKGIDKTKSCLEKIEGIKLIKI